MVHMLCAIVDMLRIVMHVTHFLGVVISSWKFSKQLPIGKYDLLDLKEACQESLLGEIGATNMLDRLQNACLYQLLKLKESGFALSL